MVEALVAEVAEPLIQPARRIRVSKEAARALAAGGRFGVVWLPVFAILSSRVGTLSSSLAISLLVAALFFAAFQGAFVSGRLTMLALGPFVAAAVGALTGLVALSALAVWIPNLGLGPVQLAEMAAFVFLGSAMWERVVNQSAASVRRVLIVGASDGGSELIEDLALAQTPFEVIGIVDDDRESDSIAGTPLHGRVAELPRIIEAHRPDIVVLALHDGRPSAFAYLLDAAGGSSFKVVGLPEFYEHVFGRVPMRTVTATWFWSVLHLYQRPYTRIAKRTFDIVVASAGLLLTGWLFPILALLVKRTKGPVIYRQTRLGEAGTHFTIYKFRTMGTDAEAGGAPVWAAEGDARVTRVGRFLRITRFDELPQLWNVLRGDMSVVGPRPERPEFLEQLQEELPFWTRRHMVKPGITGWAQVRRGYTSDASGTGEKLSYDLWYLRHRSLVVDLAICFKTFATVLTGTGAR